MRRYTVSNLQIVTNFTTARNMQVINTRKAVATVIIASNSVQFEINCIPELRDGRLMSTYFKARLFSLGSLNGGSIYPMCLDPIANFNSLPCSLTFLLASDFPLIAFSPVWLKLYHMARRKHYYSQKIITDFSLSVFSSSVD